jgi:hypothetical protein
MNTTLYETKDRARGIRAGQRHIGGEQYRREMRAALHQLQQRLGQCHNGPSIVQVVVTAGPAPVDRMSNERTIVPEAQGFLHHFYFLHSSMNADK